MRAITAIALTLISLNSFALPDATTVEKVQVLKSNLRAEADKTKRLALFEEFRDFLFDRLQTIELPRTPQQKTEFAELNEFESNVFMVRFDAVDKASCTANWKKIALANALNRDFKNDGDMKISPSAIETLEIVKLICE